MGTKRKKVQFLLVDDNDHQHELFQVYTMGSDRFQSLRAVTIEEALSVIGEYDPKLVLLDHRLHPFDSFRQTVPMLRDAGYEGRIVVISADVDDRDFARADELGVDKCLNKFEFSLDNFEEKMIELMGGEEAL